MNHLPNIMSTTINQINNSNKTTSLYYFESNVIPKNRKEKHIILDIIDQIYTILKVVSSKYKGYVKHSHISKILHLSCNNTQKKITIMIKNKLLREANDQDKIDFVKYYHYQDIKASAIDSNEIYRNKLIGKVGRLYVLTRNGEKLMNILDNMIDLHPVVKANIEEKIDIAMNTRLSVEITHNRYNPKNKKEKKYID